MSELRYVIDICGLEEEIRCAICENPMHTDKWCDGNCKYNEKAFKRITDLLDKRIELLPIAPEPHWIPVTERLPKEETDVLVTVHFLGLNRTHRNGWNAHIKESFYVEVASHINGEWSSASGEYKIAKDRHKVVAWMPLPEPYKGVTT